MDLNLLFQELENTAATPKAAQIISSITQYLNSTHFQLSRPLFQSLPQFCTFLFGANTSKKGYFHSIIKDKMILDFLKPNSVFLLVLLSLEQDTTAVYAVGPDYLPAPSKRIFLSPDWSQLPQIYKKAITTTQNDQKNQIHQMMFNMFQYYCYCFSLCPTFVQEKSDKRLQFILDQQYFDLLAQYLDFFLPFKSAVKELPSTPKGKVLNVKPVQEVLDDSNVFKCNATENLTHALNASQFFLDSLIEMWLCQNDYELLESPGLKVPVYIRPNQQLIKSITILVKRLVDMDLSVINGDQASRVYFDRHSGQSHVVYDINKANTYKSISVKLFRFLCNAMQHWSNDDSIAEIVDLWLLFAFPWKSKNQKYSNEWSQYVQENFLYYTKLLQLFVNRSLSFDFYASARPAMKKNTVQTNSLRYLNIMEKVLDHFDDFSLMETVRSIERALLSLKSYAATPLMGSPMLSSKTPLMPTTPRTPKSVKDGGNVAQIFRNSGPKTRLIVALFEGTYRYTPIFEIEETDREKSGGGSNRLVARLWDTSERLAQVKTVKTHPKKESHSDSPIKFLQDTYSSLFGDGSDTGNSGLGPEQLQLLEKNCGRIRKIIDGLCDLLGLVNPSVAPPMNMRRSASDLIGADDEGDIQEWAPGVCEPQRIREMGNTLTLRGRSQIKYGVRKSNADDIPILLSTRYQTMIRGNESPFLLSWAQFAIQKFDEKYAQLRREHAFLPKVSIQWIRFFSCWDRFIPLVIVLFLFIRAIFI